MKMSLFCIVSLAGALQFASAQDVQRQMIRNYAPDLRFVGRVPLGIELNTEMKAYEAIGGQLNYMTGTPLFLHVSASLPLSNKGLRDYDALVGCIFWDLSGIADDVNDKNINHEAELVHDREFWVVRAGMQWSNPTPAAAKITPGASEVCLGIGSTMLVDAAVRESGQINRAQSYFSWYFDALFALPNQVHFGGGSMGFRFMGTFDISVPISNTIEVGVRPYFGGSYLRDSIGWYFLN